MTKEGKKTSWNVRLSSGSYFRIDLTDEQKESIGRQWAQIAEGRVFSDDEERVREHGKLVLGFCMLNRIEFKPLRPGQLKGHVLRSVFEGLEPTVN